MAGLIRKYQPQKAKLPLSSDGKEEHRTYAEDHKGYVPKSVFQAFEIEFARHQKITTRIRKEKRFHKNPDGFPLKAGRWNISAVQR